MTTMANAQKPQTYSALLDTIAALQERRIYIVCLCGRPGSGKTTLARQLVQAFSAKSLHISEDDFCHVPTAKRKSYLEQALKSGDLARLQALTDPTDAADNPYANPLSWYDWPGLRRCLETLRAGKKYERHNAWDQKTGACDRHVVYVPGDQRPYFCFLDANYPLDYRALIDLLVWIDVSPEEAHRRSIARDSHRSDPAYFAYKAMNAEKYGHPYAAQVQQQADFLLQPPSMKPNSCADKARD